MKEVTITFRCSKKEEELLKSLAQEIKITPSNYLRHLINIREKPKILPKEEKKEDQIEKSLQNLFATLSRTGGNLNQIAHYFNLEHLKSFDDDKLTAEAILLLNKLDPEDLQFIRVNLESLESDIGQLKQKLVEVFNVYNSVKN